jgi:hypothetical protein
MSGMVPGIQMLVRMDNGKTSRVQRGSAWYLAYQERDLKKHHACKSPVLWSRWQGVTFGVRWP